MLHPGRGDGRPRGLEPGTRTRLNGSLDERYRPFAEAVVAQAAHPLGAPSGREDAAAARVVRLLREPGGEDPDALAEDAALLAVLFQNLDLLPPAPDAAAEALCALVAEAARRLDVAG